MKFHQISGYCIFGARAQGIIGIAGGGGQVKFHAWVSLCVLILTLVLPAGDVCRVCICNLASFMYMTVALVLLQGNR